MADPLIKEPQLIFPDNMQDIEYVCRKWNNFVDCIKRFTDRCFTEKQRRQFNKAVENPIESVHQMCTQPDYQKEYLHYAPCMKNTVTERAYCAPHYTLLVDQVSQGDVISKSVLCCSHNRFRECVLRETRRICDRGIPDGPATRFSSHIIDKALSFLQEQCFNYIPNSDDCSLPTETLESTDFLGSTPPSLESRWNNNDEQISSSKSILTSILTPPKSSATPSWIETSDPEEPDVPSISILGSRSRPSSYGRSKSWSNLPSNDNANTHPLIPNTAQFSHESPQTITTSSWIGTSLTHGSEEGQQFDSPNPTHTTVDQFTLKKTDGENNSPEDDQSSDEELPSVAPTPEESNTFHRSFPEVVRTPQDPQKFPTLFGQSPGIVSETSRDVSLFTEASSMTSTSTETWYPAAGNQLSNEVDEPNQQGWVKPDNAGSKGARGCGYLSLTFVTTAMSRFF